jgi:hypothetical protein
VFAFSKWPTTLGVDRGLFISSTSKEQLGSFHRISLVELSESRSGPDKSYGDRTSPVRRLWKLV